MADIRLKKISIDSSPLTIQNGTINISNTESSIDSISGSLRLTGGLAINCSSDAISSTSGGAITIAGGFGVLKKIIGGSDIVMDSSNSIFRIGGISNDRLLVDNTTNKQIIIRPDGITTKFLLTNSSLTLYNTDTSSNLTTGSLICFGGISINCTSDSTNISNGGALTIGGGISIAKKALIGGGIVSLNSNTFGSIIITSGNIGINTIPTCPLDVLGNVKISDSITTSNININTNFNIGTQFYNDNNSFGITNGSVFVIQEEIEPTGLSFVQNSSGNYVSLIAHENIFNIINCIGNTVSSSLYINTNGNIGINNTSPSFLLDINGISNSLLYTGANLSISGTVSSSFVNTNKIITLDMTTSNAFASNITSGTIKSTSIDSTNLISSNNTLSNINTVNITSNSIISTNLTSNSINTSNMTCTNLFSSNITCNSINTSSLIVSNSANIYSDSNTFASIITTNGNIGIGDIPMDTIKLDVFGNLQCNSNVFFTNSVGNVLNIYGNTTIYKTTDATGLSNGSLHLEGGVSILKNVFIGGETYFKNTTLSTSYSDGAIHVDGGLTISCAENSTAIGNGGALTVQGGTSIGGDLYIGGQINGSGSSSSTFAYLTLTATDEALNLTSGTLVVFGGITIQCTTNSVDVSNGGALLIAGGASVGGNLYIGGDTYNYGISNLHSDSNENIIIYNGLIKRYSIDCNTSSKDFSLARYDTNGDFISNIFEVVYSSGKTTFSNTSPSVSLSNSALTVNGGVSIGATSISSSLSNGGALTIGGGASISKNLLIGGDTKIYSTTVSNDVSSGALIVDGGVAIAGNCNILGNTIMTGNLTVNGTTTTIVSNNTSIGDNILVLNSGPSGSKDAGIITQRFQADNDTGSGDVVNDINYISDTLPLQTGMTSNQIKFSNSTSSVDNFYTGWWIKVSSGFSNNQVRKITNYIGSTRVATVSSNWTTQNPTISDNIYLFNKPFVGFIFNEINDRFELGSSVSDPGQTNVVFTDRLPLYLSGLTCVSTTVSINSSTGSVLLNGGLSINETSDASSITNGGTITSRGGASIGKKLYVGTDLYVGNTNLTPHSEDIFKSTSFTAANNQPTFTDITGLVFSSNVWSFDVFLSCNLLATTNMYSNFHIRGINKSSSWEIIKNYVGDDTGIEFNITNSGQLQYTSLNYAGFSSLIFKFRALAN